MWDILLFFSHIKKETSMKEIQNLFSIPKNTQELIQKMFFF